MATSTQLSLHLPILPSKEGSSQKNPSEYQCPVWPCHPLASCQTQIHSTTGSSSLDVITVPKPSRTLDHHPCLRIKYQGEIRTNEDAAIQRWGSHSLLCSSSAGQQHPRALLNAVLDRHRCINQMVAWKTGPVHVPLAPALRYSLSGDPESP